MSHEKCLKQVKTPCSSVAPSLVRVRVKCGLCAGQAEGAGWLCGRQSLGWYSGLRSDGMGRGTRLGLGWERPLCCSEFELRTAPLCEPLPSQPGLLPTAPHPSLHFPQHSPSCLLVGPPPLVFHPGCPKRTTGEQTWGSGQCQGFLVSAAGWGRTNRGVPQQKGFCEVTVGGSGQPWPYTE